MAALLIGSFCPAMASAKCGTGNPLSYADIDAIMLGQNYANGQEPPTYRDRVTSFAKSTFWVFFWNNGRDEVPTTYTQFDLRDSVGTFHLSATLAEARNILRRHNFFELSPPDDLVTDTLQTVLYVKRCGVITTIRSYVSTWEGQDAATRSLFDDLRSVVRKANKTQISSTPKGFEQTLLFDP